MSVESHSETLAAGKLSDLSQNVDAMRVRWMIEQLRANASRLDEDIASEELRTQVFNRQDPTYSIVAEAMHTKRENLSLTIAALEEQFGGALGRPVAEK